MLHRHFVYSAVHLEVLGGGVSGGGHMDVSVMAHHEMNLYTGERVTLKVRLLRENNKCLYMYSLR